MERFSELRRDLERLSRFGSNLADAHSCLILLPSPYIYRSAESLGSESSGGFETHLVIGGFHSLSDEIDENARFSIDGGLIGWVSKHGRSIHVSPFEHDSRTLGMYRSDQELKSFIGIPVNLDAVPHRSAHRVGVIACDSKKSFAFSKLQGKLLEDLALEVANTSRLFFSALGERESKSSWDEFLERTCGLGQSIGYLSLEIIRLVPKNFAEMEGALGTMKAIEISEQISRLVQQAIPPHFPMLQLPSGDIVLAIDTMLSSFIENKVRALCQHIAFQDRTIEFEFVKNPVRRRKERSVHLETLIAETASAGGFVHRQDKGYEYRRAQ